MLAKIESFFNHILVFTLLSQFLAPSSWSLSSHVLILFFAVSIFSVIAMYIEQKITTKGDKPPKMDVKQILKPENKNHIIQEPIKQNIPDTVIFQK